MNLLTKGGIGMICLLLSLDCLAQGTGLMRTDLISPSPTAANLAKYGETPVTYYTGLPNVSIPIFNVQGHELSLPITLSYNYSGLQPTQQAGWVGLGWSLQAGGVITRTIGDKVEDLDIGENYDRETATNVGADEEYFYQSYEYANYDNLPDIFSFNFAGYSGKFIMYEDTAYIMPDQKISIRYDDGFIVTTEDGTQYEFTETEETSLRSGPGSPYPIPPYISAWYLTKITNVSGTESITLAYASDGTVRQYGQQTQQYKHQINTPGIVVDHPGSLSQVFPTQVTAKRLESIYSDKFRVYFNAGDDRDDISVTGATHAKTLGSIQISSCCGNVKRINFNYGYFGSETKFLKLTSIVEDGFEDGQAVMKHTFSYYNEEGSFGTGATSFIDKYGYFLSGTIPTVSGIGMIMSNEVYASGVDRTPNFAATVTGALKTITYPTGGSTTFTYEPNRYFVNEPQLYQSFPRTATALDIRNNHSWQNSNFWIEKTTNVEVSIYRVPKNIPIVHTNSDDYQIRGRSTDSLGHEVIENSVHTSGQLYHQDLVGTETVLIEDGTYQLRAVADADEDSVTIVLHWTFESPIPKLGALGPGIRLKQLTHDNGFGKTITKSFRYVDDAGLCSGEIKQSNNFDIRDFTEYYYDSLGNPDAPSYQKDYVVYTAMIAETSGAGLPIYYKSVFEETTVADEIHRMNYKYYYFPDTKSTELIEQREYALIDTTIVLKTKVANTFSQEYDGEGFGGMEIYVRGADFFGGIESEPQNRYGASLKLEKVSWKHAANTSQTQYEKGQSLVTQTRSYYDVAGTRNITATKQVNSDGSTLYTRYKYPEDYSGISDITSLVSSHMLSPVIEEQVWRKTSAAATDSLMISGRINEYSGKRIKKVYLLESAAGIASLNNETKSGGKYTTLISDTTYYKKKIEFTYDAAGRVTQQQLTDHAPVAYLWDYDPFDNSGSAVTGKLFPVAEVTNAPASTVFYTSFENSTGEDTPDAFTGTWAKADSFMIKKSFTGSYMLTYWKKTGSNPWQLIRQAINNPTNYVISATGSIIDEVRLYPVQAQLKTYAYYPGIGIRSVCDANNIVTRYRYDALGRLSTIIDHNGNITSTYDYHVKK